MIRVMLSFSNNVITEGVKSLLNEEEDLALTTVSPAEDLIGAISRDHPDVVVVDFMVLVNVMGRRVNGTKAILLDTGCGDDNVNYAFLSKGISGFIRSDSDALMLTKAIRFVHDGHVWIDRQSSRKLVAHLHRIAKLSHLSAREEEVLTLFTRGMSYRMISDTLSIRQKTVNYHIDNVKKKTDAATNGDLMRMSLHYHAYNNK